MRVDWNQSLEGFTLLEIRNHLRSLRGPESGFTTDYIARRIINNEDWGSWETDLAKATARAQNLINGLVVSGLLTAYSNHRAPERGWYMMTAAGRSLTAAGANKRFKRLRADKALARLLEVVHSINSNPIFLHDVSWLAVYGSYITDASDLGDIDVAYELKARYTPRSASEHDFDDRDAAFKAAFPPPASVEADWMADRFWAETYTRRLLRPDKAINLTPRTELEHLGCAYRILLPKRKDVAAKPDWSCARAEIILKPDDGSAQQIMDAAFAEAEAAYAKHRAEQEAYWAKLRAEQQPTQP